MLASFLIDTGSRDDLFPWGYENIFRNGEFVGYVTSTAYGYTVGGHVCMGVIRAGAGETVSPSFVEEGQYEVEVNGERCPARVSLRPLYDPKSLRLRM